MASERTNEGWQLRLRPQGGGRYVTGAFLAFWLCGWAVGEAFALWVLIRGAYALLTGTPLDPAHEPLQLVPALAAGAFLLFWLAIWTFGGIGACSELFRILWGEDVLTVASGRLSATWARGPIRTVRTFERDAIRRILLVGREDRLALETQGKRVDLSGLGSRTERFQAAQELRAEFGLSEETSSAATAGPPPGWEEIITPEGRRALVANQALRRKQAQVASVATLLLAGLTVTLARQAASRLDLLIPAFILFVITLGLVAGTLWLARGRWEWRIGTDHLTLCRRYGTDLREVFEARRLMLDRATDSDGDTAYELLALADAGAPPAPKLVTWRTAQPRNRRTIARALNDASAVRDLGAWLARASGVELDDRTTPQAREAQLAELGALLANAGTVGKWAGKLVDRVRERRRNAG